MRTRPAAALSMAGVLAAGLVAALVNAQALAGSRGRADSSIGSTQLPGTLSIDSAGSSTTVDSAAVSTSSSPPSSVARSTFPVAAAGQVTLDQYNAVLTLAEITPALGWSVTAIRSTGTDTITIGFVSSTSTLDVVATLRDGEITVTLTTTATTATTTISAVPPPATPPATGSSVLVIPPPPSATSSTQPAPPITSDDDGSDDDHEPDD